MVHTLERKNHTLLISSDHLCLLRYLGVGSLKSDAGNKCPNVAFIFSWACVSDLLVVALDIDDSVHSQSLGMLLKRQKRGHGNQLARLIGALVCAIGLLIGLVAIYEVGHVAI